MKKGSEIMHLTYDILGVSYHDTTYKRASQCVQPASDLLISNTGWQDRNVRVYGPTMSLTRCCRPRVLAALLCSLMLNTVRQ
jgi:hypothetical protein